MPKTMLRLRAVDLREFAREVVASLAKQVRRIPCFMCARAVDLREFAQEVVASLTKLARLVIDTGERGKGGGANDMG